VKKVARQLLAKLSGVFTIDWQKTAQVRARVRDAIEAHSMTGCRGLIPPRRLKASRRPLRSQGKATTNADHSVDPGDQARISAMVRFVAALDEILATIRRLPLPERLRLIARATLDVAEDTPKPGAVTERARTLSVDEFLAARLTPPPGVGPVSLDDMDRAIAEGASGRGSV